MCKVIAVFVLKNVTLRILQVLEQAVNLMLKCLFRVHRTIHTFTVPEMLRYNGL